MKIDKKRLSFAILLSTMIIVILGLAYSLYRFYNYSKDLEEYISIYNQNISQNPAGHVSMTLAVSNNSLINLPLLIGILIICFFVLTIIFYYVLDKLHQKRK
jgi:uncharacterized membrane protein SpoIIM required for sporulation